MARNRFAPYLKLLFYSRKSFLLQKNKQTEKEKKTKTKTNNKKFFFTSRFKTFRRFLKTLFLICEEITWINGVSLCSKLKRWHTPWRVLNSSWCSSAISTLYPHTAAVSNVTCLLFLDFSNGGTCGKQSRQFIMHLIYWSSNVENILFEDFSILYPLIIFDRNGLYSGLLRSFFIW